MRRLFSRPVRWIGVLLCGGLVAAMSGMWRQSGAETSLPPEAAKARKVHAPVDPALVAADNGLGFALFRRMAAHDAGENVFISPTSIALALQMTYNGADGQTRQAMETALRLHGMSQEQVNQGNSALLASLYDPDPKVNLHIANSLWYWAKERPVADFVTRDQRYYGAELGSLAGAPDTVNAWVRKQTNDRIKSIVGRGDMRGLVAILLNAVYFKGSWDRAFEPRLTHDNPFTRLDGTRQTCRMMHQSGKFSYFADNRAQALRLPYGNGRLAMELVLPVAGTDFKTFVAALTPEMWDGWTRRMASREGTIGMPRFRSEYEAELAGDLSAEGMGIAFSGRADFRRMFAAGGVNISQVKHKTFVEVNEEGTEAAAATGVFMSKAMAVGPNGPFQMILDRPFACAIRDTKTGALLFLGAIVNPTASAKQ